MSKDNMENMEGEVGMHMHSCYSDGSDSPMHLAMKIANAGLRGACLTDHDTLEGFEEFEKITGRLGVDVIPAVEISTHWERRSFIHLLAFGKYGETCQILSRELSRNVAVHNDIFDEMMRRAYLEYPNILTGDQVREKTGQRGKANFLLPSMRFFEQCFELKPGEFVESLFGGELTIFNEPIREGLYLSTEEAITAIHKAGWKAVMAHPGSFSKYTIDGGKGTHDFERLFHELVDMGLAGIEAYYTSHTAAETAYFERLAVENGLWRTAGSDYHGSYKSGYGLAMKGMSFAEFIDFKAFCEA